MKNSFTEASNHLWVAEVSWAQEVSHELEEVIIWGSSVWTIYWVRLVFWQKSSFSVNQCWVYLPHNDIHLLQLIGVQVGFDRWFLQNKLQVNYPFIILPDAEHHLVFEKQILQDSSIYIYIYRERERGIGGRRHQMVKERKRDKD